MPKLPSWLGPAGQFLKNYQRQIWTGAGILISTYFSAKAVAMLISYFLLPLELDESSAQVELDRRGAERLNISRIISRNIFQAQEKPAQELIAEPVTPDEDEIIPSSINAELLATVVFRNARYSVALMNDRSANSTSYFAIGDLIQGATLVKIERFRIILQRAGRYEFLEVQSAKSTIEMNNTQPTSSSLARRPSASPSESLCEFGEGQGGTCQIPESFIESSLSDLSSILRQARAIPVSGPNNQLQGFRLVEIKPDSIFEKIGLKNGDVIRRVNDDELNSVEKGMSLFTALRNEKSISIDIERGGSRLSYTYEIR